MRLDTNKIDERIKKLQEIQRIAADAEMLQILFEFIDMDGGPANHRPVGTSVEAKDEPKPDFALPASDEAAAVINGIMKTVPSSATRRP